MFTDITALLEDPTLPELLGKIDARLREEQKRRAKFLKALEPHIKAEFINGEVVMHSPATYAHTRVRQQLENLLFNYVEHRGIGIVCDEKALCSFPRNDYEPDVIFFGRKKAASIKSTTLRFPVPDFICEVLSPGTAGRDRGVKFRDFEAHGVTEYWIIDPKAKVLEQYVIGPDKLYELRLKSGTGEVASVAIKGFVMPIRALFDAATHRKTLAALLAM